MPTPSVSIKDIEQAQARISQFVTATPLVESQAFSNFVGHEVYFKLESAHPTGSFKERGGCNFIASLSKQEAKTGVVAASLGSHALALARHTAIAGIGCTIVMPRSAPLMKVERTKGFGAKVELYGDTFDEALKHAQEFAKQKKRTFVPAFDHPAIIAGQGTVGLELCDQLSDFDSVVAPIGGGGLISGIAIALRALRPKTYILGTRSEWAERARSGNLDPIARTLRPSTIADGVGVKQIGKITGEIIRQHVDKVVTVSEGQIAGAVVQFLDLERKVAEGAGAIALAGLTASNLPKKCKKTVVIISGSNIDLNVLARLVQRELAERGQLFHVKVSLPDRPGSLRAATEIVAEHGGNILSVNHDHSFSSIPGYVAVTFAIEVRDKDHQDEILSHFLGLGLSAERVYT